MLQVCPFPCGCVCELWIMFVHLMDHLSTKTELEVWETDYDYYMKESRELAVEKTFQF